jgi:hypothetical protein
MNTERFRRDASPWRNQVKDPAAITVRRQPLWRSENGRFVVVAGPFPQGFTRTVDAASVKVAAGRNEDEIFARDATTKDTRFAKTLSKYVIPTENEWGEISP